MDNYKNYTNAELNIKLKTLDDEYKSKQTKAIQIINEMKGISLQYDKIKKEINKRQRGLWQ